MIFISYRISDALDLVDRLDADLTCEFGSEAVFRDKSRLVGGQNWSEELERNAKLRKIMLVMIGPQWQKVTEQEGEYAYAPRLFNPNDWVRKEIKFSLEAGNIVIPVFLNGATLPPEGWLKNCGLDMLHQKQGEKLRTAEYLHDRANLIAVIRKHGPGLRPGPHHEMRELRPRLPVPPQLYAVPNYILTNTFIGRATELDELDTWARSTDPIMVVEGIGGLGKSALTWEWMKKRAEYAIHGLAGRVWWSFYEKGTSMTAFVRHALAYITGQDPESLRKESNHYERCQELLTELQRRPFLLVLDGFERVLTAYHRWDKAQQRDDKIETDLRECVEPRDTDLLQQLICAQPSKVLLSTRLFPSALEDRATSSPIPGVAHHKLNGLSRPDALAFFQHSRIKGNEEEMLNFADEFGRHSLLLKVICGEIAKYRKRPFHFDAWRADPICGGKLRLSELDLKQRYNHILRFALEGLDEKKRKLFCRIAVLSENVTYDTLAVLNPFLPPKPSEPEYRQAIRDFDKSLQELQDRGLLQWDREGAYYDMHPVVRGHAAELLEERDRTETFLTVRDHFAGFPPDDFEKATELSHVSHSLEIYRCLVGAGKLEEAVNHLASELIRTLYHHIGAYSVIPELASALFTNRDFRAPPLVQFNERFGRILDCLGNSLSDTGKKTQAITVYGLILAYDLRGWSPRHVAMDLRNLWEVYIDLDRRAEGLALLNSAQDICTFSSDHDGLTKTWFNHLCQAILQGQFDACDRIESDFRSQDRPPQVFYQTGDLEYWCSVRQFFQGRLNKQELQQGYELTVHERNVRGQHRFLSLRSEVELCDAQPLVGLEAIEEAMKLANRLGTPLPRYHDLRAWALARLGRSVDARAELKNGEHRRYAAEAWLVLDDRAQARICALNAYRWAWGEGPPYIHWYELERSRAILKEMGESEPQLPPFDPKKVKPIPHEQEIRAMIGRLRAK